MAEGSGRFRSASVCSSHALRQFRVLHRLHPSEVRPLKSYIPCVAVMLHSHLTGPHDFGGICTFRDILREVGNPGV